MLIDENPVKVDSNVDTNNKRQNFNIAKKKKPKREKKEVDDRPYLVEDFDERTPNI